MGDRIRTVQVEVYFDNNHWLYSYGGVSRGPGCVDVGSGILEVCWVKTADPRYALKYHSAEQVVAGYVVGLATGSAWYFATEYVPHACPRSLPGRVRAAIESIWTGIGGVGGWQLGGAEGGWGEGWLCGVDNRQKKSE